MKFTKRETDILKSLAEGKKPKEIAIKLKLSEQTIRDSIRVLRRIFEADNSTTLVLEAYKQKII